MLKRAFEPTGRMLLVVLVPVLAAACLMGVSPLSEAQAAQPAPPPVRTFGGIDPGFFGSVPGVAVDRGGNIYVSDYDNARIQKFDARGNSLLQFTVPTPPWGLAIDADNFLYVAGCCTSPNLFKFTDTGTLVTSWYGRGGWR